MAAASAGASAASPAAGRAWALPAAYRATVQVSCQGDLASLVRQANVPLIQVRAHAKPARQAARVVCVRTGLSCAGSRARSHAGRLHTASRTQRLQRLRCVVAHGVACEREAALHACAR